jgi:hypothetical protein
MSAPINVTQMIAPAIVSILLIHSALDSPQVNILVKWLYDSFSTKMVHDLIALKFLIHFTILFEQFKNASAIILLSIYYFRLFFE